MRLLLLLLALALPAFGQKYDDSTCSQNGGNEVSLACQATPYLFNKARNIGNSIGQYGTHRRIQTTGPGWNFGNEGGWRIQKLDDGLGIFAARGIHQWMSFSAECHAVGDCAGGYFYLFSDGGINGRSDEGTTMLTLRGGELKDYFHGTIRAASAGSIRPTLAFNSGNNWTTDGTFLLDISKGTLAGHLAAYSVPLPAPFASYLAYLPVEDVRLPLTTAWGEIVVQAGNDHAIPNPRTTPDAPISTTFTVAIQPIGRTFGEFHTGVACLAGNLYPEQVAITAAPRSVKNRQTITASVRNPNLLATLFQGGICGQYISFDTNLAVGKYRTSYYAFGSLTGSDLIYGNNIAGHLGIRRIPDENGSEPETVAPPNNGFHLYPGAEVVTNNTLAADPILEANSVPWAPRDLVEDPHFQTVGGHGLVVDYQQNSPTNSAYGAGAVAVTLRGPGVSGNFNAFDIFNGNAPETYHARGGLLAAPPMMSITGNFSDFLSSDLGPQPSNIGDNAIITIKATAQGDNTPFNLFSLVKDGQPHTSHVTYDPATGTVGLDSLRVDALRVPALKPGFACIGTQGQLYSSPTPCR